MLYAIIIMAFAGRALLFAIHALRAPRRKDDGHFALVYALLAASYGVYLFEGAWDYAVPVQAWLDATLMIVLVATTVQSVQYLFPGKKGDAK
jgi:hypothetical protein